MPLELDPASLKWFKLGVAWSNGCFLKGPLGLQLQANWIHPKVNFFHLVSCNQVQGDGDVLKFRQLVVWAALENEEIWGQSHGPSPSPALPQHFDPGTLNCNECQRQMWRGKRKWLIPYTPGQFTEHQISKQWASFSNKFALFVNELISFHNCSLIFFLILLFLADLKDLLEILVEFKI